MLSHFPTQNKKMDNMDKTLLKKVHPSEKASAISHIFFFWQLHILLKGYKKQFTENDLYEPLKEHQSKILGDKFEKAWLDEVAVSGRDASLWKVLAKVFGSELAYYGLIVTIGEFIVRLSQPFLIEKLLSHYETEQDHKSNTEIYLYSILIVVSVFSQVFILQAFWFGMEHLGMKIRVACSSLIYRKCLSLSQEALAEVTIGQIIILLATDVMKFNSGLIPYVHYLWVVPALIVIILYFLYAHFGVAAVTGMLVFVVFVPLQTFLSKKIAHYQSKVVQKTDERVRVMDEIVGGIKVIKMLAWEKFFIKLTENYRKLELHQIKGSLYYTVLNIFSSIFVGRSAIFFSVLTYIITGHSLHAKYVYVISAFYEIIRCVSAVFLPLAAVCIGEVITSAKRIEIFLKNDEVDSNHKSDVDVGIIIEKIRVKSDILNNITLKIRPNQIVAIIGPVGCGKSSLLQAILKEIPLLQGYIQIGGTISYASQEPWIFSGTVKNNILFGESYEEIKYHEVIKVCALERDFSVLPYGDMTLVGHKGVMLSGGQKSRINLARAVYKDADFYLLDDPLSAVDSQVGRIIFENCFKNYLRDKSTVLVTHQLQYLDDVDKIYLLERGNIVDSGTYEDLKSSEYFKFFKTERTSKNSKEREVEITKIKPANCLKAMSDQKEDLKLDVVSNKIYFNYFRAGGTTLTIALIILLHVLVQFVSNGTDYFLCIWVNLEQTKTGSVPNYFLYIYATSMVLLIGLIFCSAVAFVMFLNTSSKNLHNRMFNKVVYASMDFFSAKTSGQILNRFSSDIEQIDKRLPVTVVRVIQVAVTFTATVALNVIINVWILLPTLIIVIIFFYARKVYLSTSRILKRIEAQSRSPIFTHLSTTLQGLSTIRALDGTESQKDIFESHQDIHSRSHYMFFACDSAFGFWLDFCCSIYFSIIIFSLLYLKSETYGGNIGLSIISSYALLGMLQYGMKQYAELENQMVSVERVIEYTEIDTEQVSKSNLTHPWPRSGKIELRNVSLRYHPKHPMVLKQMTFVIKPNEKIGIVGRTGAGKSSLISVLFGLFEYEGDVIIDGINTKTISLHKLRTEISIIPQEPVLFSCSIRSNLDPFDQYQDSQLWDVLDEVELRRLISGLPSGLFSKLTEGGQNFSVGEKQLLCLARAIIKMNKILILDEATANIDYKTDELIRNTIRKKFKECTVLTIAHRIHSVIDCDKILVIEDGCVLEFDAPSKLLQDVNGAFYRLVHLGKS